MIKNEVFEGRSRERKSNLELFRICSMLVIIAHHYVVNSGLLDCIRSQTILGTNDFFLLLFGWGGKTAINCFVLITGYYMCKSQISIKKWMKLLFEVEFYNIVIFGIFLWSRYEIFSLKGLAQVIFPFFNIDYSFSTCFLLFYLFIPFLNKLIYGLSKREHWYLLVLCMIVYTILPSFAGVNVIFNYVTWFCIIYILASYIRLYPKTWFDNVKLWGGLLILMLALSWGSVVTLAIIAGIMGKGFEISFVYFLVSDSNKIFAVTTAVCAFMFFKRVDIGCSKVINTIASSTFGVLMIHANSNTMRQWLWKDVCNNVTFYDSKWLIIHAVGCVLLIYLVCTIVDMMRIKCLENLFLKLKELLEHIF